jgi:mannitol/fructose-specific phosphotransferase system IIA component (Ntr-type)
VLVHESLSPETIEILDSSTSASELISRMSEQLGTRLSVDHARLEQAVIEREEARTTALPNGAAIPHCRLPDLQQFRIALTILHKPIIWDNEGHKVDVVLMIAGPSKSVPAHLRILANSSQLLDSQALRAKLKQAPDGAAAYELISAAEEAIEERRAQTGMLREVRKDQENGNGDFLAEVADRFKW